MKVEENPASMGLRVPEPMQPLANYVAAILARGILYSSGTSCFVDGKAKYLGKVGGELTLEEGYEAGTQDLHLKQVAFR